MGMVKDLVMEYCEAIHPDNWGEQDKLFEEICQGKHTNVSLEDMSRVVQEFRLSGRIPEQPALTLNRMLAELEDNEVSDQ